MKLPLIRKAAIGFLLLDVLVIGAASVRVEDVATRTTDALAAGVPAGTLPVDATGQVPALTDVPLPGAVPLGGGGVSLAGAPVAPVLPPSAGTDPDADPGKGEPAPPGGKGPRPKPPTDVPGEGDPAGRGIPPCPVKLSDSPQTGGLQSLVPFAPAFGPFSAEAFALASAYQPELQLLGPILAQYPSIEPVVAPALTPLASTLGTLLAKGLDVITPLYGPYRTRFLEAETKLAAALAPYSKALAHNALGGCIVELQTALLTASRTGVPGVPAPSGRTPSGLSLSGLGIGGLL